MGEGFQKGRWWKESMEAFWSEAFLNDLVGILGPGRGRYQPPANRPRTNSSLDHSSITLEYLGLCQ